MSHSAINSINCTANTAKDNKDDADGGGNGVSNFCAKLSNLPSLHYGQHEIQQEDVEAQLMCYLQSLKCQRLHT